MLLVLFSYMCLLVVLSPFCVAVCMNVHGRPPVPAQAGGPTRPHSFSPLSLHSRMTQLSSTAKHHILLEYRALSPSHSFAALAARHGIAGGADVVRHWHDRWDGTPQSLERRAGSGRPRALTRSQANDCVRTPIKNKRRAHAAVHYPDLLPSLQHKTGKQISLRTLQRYGQREFGVKLKHTHTRTEAECECTHTREREEM